MRDLVRGGQDGLVVAGDPFHVFRQQLFHARRAIRNNNEPNVVLEMQAINDFRIVELSCIGIFLAGQ